jgi:hypothetical protein
MEFEGDGIYFGLDESHYHSIPWLGSSNVKQLYASPPDYWWGSHMNPMRPADEGKSHAQAYGTALHHRILYGEASFKKAYVRMDGETKDEVSSEGLKTWIKDNGGIPAKLKADNEAMVANEFKVNLLTETTYDAIMVASQMILKNPHLAQAFAGGWPEVSVFWHQEGIPCKARFDYLKKSVIVDLKSFRQKDRIKSLDQTILQDLFSYRYDVQAAHYLNGHDAGKALIADSKVFVGDGGTRPTDEWLVEAFRKPAHWSFVFFKADGMPVAKSFQVPNGSPAHASGRFSAATAYRNYQIYLEKFGTDAWVNDDEPFTIAEEDMPKWL